MARPMPRDAPVTSATFPFSEISTAAETTGVGATSDRRRQIVAEHQTVPS